jgi:hypothetical protein
MPETETKEITNKIKTLELIISFVEWGLGKFDNSTAGSYGYILDSLLLTEDTSTRGPHDADGLHEG